MDIGMLLAGALVWILEAGVWLLFESGISLVVEILFELGGGPRRDRRSDPSPSHPVVAGTGFAFIGVFLGGLSFVLLPQRLVAAPPIPGASLVAAPIVVGAVMSFVGERRRANGHATSHLATFWGGAVFAFWMALARFAFMHLSG